MSVRGRVSGGGVARDLSLRWPNQTADGVHIASIGVVPGSTRPGRVGVLEFDREAILADQSWAGEGGVVVSW